MAARSRRRAAGCRDGIHHQHTLSLCWRFFFGTTSLLSVAQARHTHTDSFPTYDEYDMNILDPNTVFGSPYGGFSRATASRLAALPLYLPHVTNDIPIDPFYMKVRDAQGRLYACRVYHEDELEPDSLEESMFDAPRLRVAGKEYPKKRKEPAAPGTIVKAPFKLKLAVGGETDDTSKTEEIDPTPEPGIVRTESMTMTAEGRIENLELSKDGSHPINKVGIKKTPQDVENRLSVLRGLCAHFHTGWWSYEWCSASDVTQFHREGGPNPGDNVIISDKTSLGIFERRIIQTEPSHMQVVNPLAEGLLERARVVEIYKNGDICPETGEPRIAHVQLLCCSADVMSGLDGRMLRAQDNGIIDDFDMTAAIHGVHEDSDNICSYIVTVCTPILCDKEETRDNDDNDDEEEVAATSDSLNAATHKKLTSAVRNENESVREILDRTLADQCLVVNTGGWWSYEFCHKGNIRQYHATVATKKNPSSGATYRTSNVIDSEHLLGMYQKANEAESYPNEEEWKHIVNATDKVVNAGGTNNGAYFEIEYAGGEICDHSDVTDAAVIAGGAAGRSGAGVVIVARASSVRYYCGDAYFVSVREDATCHYIVEVTVPDLCHHALFQAPVLKQQIVKCLPVVE